MSLFEQYIEMAVKNFELAERVQPGSEDILLELHKKVHGKLYSFLASNGPSTSIFVCSFTSRELSMEISWNSKDPNNKYWQVTQRMENKEQNTIPRKSFELAWKLALRVTRQLTPDRYDQMQAELFVAHFPPLNSIVPDDAKLQADAIRGPWDAKALVQSTYQYTNSGIIEEFLKLANDWVRQKKLIFSFLGNFGDAKELCSKFELWKGNQNGSAKTLEAFAKYTLARK